MQPFKRIYSKVKKILSFGLSCRDCLGSVYSGEYYVLDRQNNIPSELICTPCLKRPHNNMLYYFLWNRGKLRDKDKPKGEEWA